MIKLVLALSMAISVSLSFDAFAQGQDSTEAERDLLVLKQMLPGRYDNVDQYYFERRGERAESELHSRVHTRVTALGENAFEIADFLEGDVEKPTRQSWYRLKLSEDKSRVLMDVGAGPTPNDDLRCVFEWRREAAQFKATPITAGCEPDLEFQLSETYLFRNEKMTGDGLTAREAGGPYRLARARTFECYLDYPGASGGADIPFKRHTGIFLHDKGGVADITVQDGRVFRLRLRLVDWPINNYEGFFSRDSLVIYLDEVVAGEVKPLAYAFTEPQVSRVAVNLRSVMGRCFQVSGYEQVPFF